jgi:hypothetical protein
MKKKGDMDGSVDIDMDDEVVVKVVGELFTYMVLALELISE